MYFLKNKKMGCYTKERRRLPCMVMMSTETKSTPMGCSLDEFNFG
jgi:hypothetical protein